MDRSSCSLWLIGQCGDDFGLTLKGFSFRSLYPPFSHVSVLVVVAVHHSVRAAIVGRFVVEAFGVGRLSDQRSNSNERGCGNHFFAPECWQLIYCAAQLVATKDWAYYKAPHDILTEFLFFRFFYGRWPIATPFCTLSGRHKVACNRAALVVVCASAL